MKGTTLYNNLKRLREKNNLEQEEIASKLNIGITTYYGYENGSSSPSFDILVELSTILNISLDYLILNKPQQENDYIDYVENLNSNLIKLSTLLINITENLKYIKDNKDNTNLNNNMRILPEVGEVAAGIPILCSENIETYHVVKNEIFTSDKSYYLLKIKGNSMNKLYKDGELVVIEMTNVAECNDIVIALIDNTEVTVKKYYRKNDTILLEPLSYDNSYKKLCYDKKTNVLIIGKVISKLDDIK